LSISRPVVAAALAAAAACASTFPADAKAGALITSGTLANAAGLPTSGKVSVYAWPHAEGRTRLPLLARSRTVFGGTFHLRARDDERLLRLSRPRHGWLDLMAVAETPMGLDEWTFTGFVRRAAGGVEVLSPQAALGDATAASTAIAAPRIRLRIDEPLPEARTAQQRRCDLDPETIGPQIRRAWAMVGELNNAYNDGTTARFTYGEDHVTETHFGVVTPVSGGPPGSIEIEGENTISERGRVGFPAARRRFSRRLYSFFEFERIKKRMTRCSAWDTYIKARQWIGGGDERRQRGMLDRCIPEALGDFDGGAEFHRASGKAVRWRRGVEIWGIHLTTRSGFSTHVQTHQYFGGLRRKAHYLCGKDGVGSPYSAGRIASGARTIRPTVHNLGR
jgi:hypothetical protein